MKTILILDDEEVIREAFAAYFEDHLWDPMQAESAEDALALLEKENFDAAIVDIRLPGMGGGDFIRKARLLKPKMAFAICTGSPEYLVPVDLQGKIQVSSQIFKKPITRLFELENELLEIIARIKENETQK